MSSNNPHITPLHLTRDNYEEAFLLYVDEELTAEQKAAVEAFAALHPDLQEELDILMSTKLPQLDEAIFMDKSFLMADSMKVNSIDENLLLYIDNELPASQVAAVEAKIKEDAAYSQQHQLLTKTKLDPTEKIVYPYKEELYRKTERRIYAGWWRVAAAAVVLLWAGTTTDWFDGDKTTSNTSGPVALAPAQQPPAQTNPVTKEANNDAVAVAPSNIEEVIVHQQKEKEAFSTATIENKSEVAPANTQALAATQIAAGRVNAVQTSTDFVPVAPQQIFNDAVVTSAEPVRTISTDAHTTTPVPVEEAVATAGQEKGGSLKGFLRKTTRFIERTTSINPVNADNELLIGVLAINVK
jgi:hypothetical protein